MSLLMLYVIGYVVSAYLVTGMAFSYFQGEYQAPKRRREDLGFALILGVLLNVAWPLTLPLVWLMTGFAKHGVWSKTQKEPRT